jgi:hypothetical protein
MKKPLLFPLLKNKAIALIQVFVCFLFFLGISSKMYAQIANATCNTTAPWVNGTAFNNLTATGSLSGICVPFITGVSNPENAVDANLTNDVQINLSGIGCTGSLKVVDGDAADIYPIGTFAGFKVSSANLLSGSIASTITIKTYNNGSVVETYNAVTNLVGVNTSLINGDGSTTLGFITTQPFDGVEIIYSSLLGVLNSFQVYHPVIEKFCAGPALSCATTTQLIEPDYPVIINGVNTGINGLACVGCSVNNSQNVVDNNTTNFASIVMTASVAASGSISVQDQLTDYPAGTFAGFDVENTSLIGINLLSNLKVKTYLNGAFQETSSGNLISLQLLSSTRQVVGFVATLPFDEIQLVSGGLVSVNFGTTNVYNAVLRGASAAGYASPVLSATTISNTCPTATVNLNSLVTSTAPVGASLV